MVFIGLLILVTLSIAGSAAFFSVYGLAAIFSGSFWPVVLMASSLEVGKLMAASYAYRYWNHISFALKTYLLSAILVLMLITSVGIFGFLSAAYQKDILPLAEMETKIELLDDKIVDLETLRNEERVQLQTLQDAKAREIGALPANYATKKKEVAERYAARISRVEESIAAYAVQIAAASAEKQDLKLSTLQQELKTGPIIFIAEAFGQEVNNATKWLILIIIFAFDPLAVALTVGANIALVERSKHKRRREDDRIEFAEDLDIEPTEAEEVLIEPVESVSSTQIEEAIEKLKAKEELSPMEIAQKGMLEEMLRKKQLTEKIRNPNAQS